MKSANFNKQELFNPEILNAWKEIAPDSWRYIISEIGALYFETTSQKFLELQAAVNSKNWSQVKFCAHALKSSCANIGFTSMSALLARIEKLSLESPQNISEDLSNLMLMSEEANKLFQSYLDLVKQTSVAV